MIARSINHLKKSNTRLLLIVTTAILALIVYFLTHEYNSSIAKSKAEVLHRLMAITQTTALFIDGDQHQQISERYMQRDELKTFSQDSGYAQLHDLLTKVKAENNLQSEIYTIIFYNQDSTFHFIATSANFPYYRHTYKNYPKDLLAKYETGGVLDAYEDENGIWLSAFSPIRNSAGQVIALIEADENFEWFIQRARSELLKEILISLAVIIPFGLLLFTYVSGILKSRTNDQALLISQTEKIEAQNIFIEKQNLDLDKRVKERTEELEATNLELSTFLYHSSHDVQAPIATLKGLLALSKAENRSKRMADYFNLLQGTLASLDQMVKTIKLIHDVKFQNPILKSIVLAPIIAEIADSLKSACNEMNYKIEIHADFQITTDETLLRTMLYELIKNAVQYRRSDERTPMISISATTSGDLCEIKIEDNGVGMPESVINTMFTMFKRSNEHSKGMGLGFYIVKSCLDRLHGKLMCKGAENEETRIFILLPSLNKAA